MMLPFDWAEADDLTATCAAAIQVIRSKIRDLHEQVGSWDLRPCPPPVRGR